MLNIPIVLKQRNTTNAIVLDHKLESLCVIFFILIKKVYIFSAANRTFSKENCNLIKEHTLPFTLCLYSFCRDMLAFIYIPVIQKELDIFRTTVWNHRRGRKQENKLLPTGIPDHIYENPEEYGGEDHGIAISEDSLLQVADETGVLDRNDNFLDKGLIDEFKTIITFEVEPKDAADVFILLKQHYQLGNDV